MMINALNSGARVVMADFEDALSPTWDNVVTGQWAIREAARRRLTFQTDEKAYTLNSEIATLVIRPRGWHLDEAHVIVDGAPSPQACLTSACPSSTTPASSSSAVRARISTCRSSSRTSRPRCGTTYFSPPRRHSTSRAAASGPPS